MKKHSSEIVKLLGCIVSGIGFSTIIGYLSGQEVMYRWYGQVGMAINTAIAFFFVGLALIIIGNAAHRQV